MLRPPKSSPATRQSHRDARRARIAALVVSRRVHSQLELSELLAREGLEVNQATLSRDLRDMGVVRVGGPDGPRYELDPRARYLSALREVVGMEILNVRTNGQLVVLRTLAGRAEGVAGFLDAVGNPDIIGTIAGDDTVFIAPAHPDRCDAIVAHIHALTAGDEG